MSVDSFGARPSSSSRTRSSILSRFRSQLGHRNRSISDIYIEPDDPWRSYFPGDAIKGTVVLTVVRPVRITHLVVCLHGVVKVHRNAVPASEAGPDVGVLGPGRGRRGSEYLGNGLATLFEDEVVLCGEGRLKEGIYKFRFEMGFPPYPLPSSINVRHAWLLIRHLLTMWLQFERGTIAYMLTSTLTKPTTINPTISCKRRVNFLENIDIAPFPAPKARIVTLEPVSRRSKSRVKGKSPATDSTVTATTTTPPPQAASSTADTLSREPSMNGGGSTSDHRAPLSPAPSNVSSSSRLSNSSQSFQIGSDPSSSTSTRMRNSETRSITPSTPDKTITAKTEVLRAGVLPGDSLPVHVTINHCRQVRSAHGIIITLYRQGRVDMHPSIPVGYSDDGKKPIYEDCYPKSRTGLGGLTIGTSRSSSIFRKDLSQSFAPLIVDPSNMTAVVRTSIRIPEDAFPTITRTPGGMIHFRYYVEVVADLRGKLTSPERFLPRLNMVSSGSTFSPSGQILNPADTSGTNSVTANWAGNILDTDQIRREKGVIAVAFEVVVGTRDSQRVNGARAATTVGSNAPSATPGSEFLPSVGNAPVAEGGEWLENPNSLPSAPEEYQYPVQEDYGYGFFHDPQWAEYAENYGQPPQHYHHHQPFAPMAATPEAEEPMDEKARLRQAEETLLPSRPPESPEAGPSTAELAVPTAPVLPEDDHINGYHHVPSVPVRENGISPAVMSAESVHTIVPGQHGHHPMERSSAPPVSTPTHGDDKQELERQRLMMEASAPEDPESSHHVNGAPVEEGPSAPILDEDEELVGGRANGDESLPRYQR